MNLKQLINKSFYSTIGYISSQDDLTLLEQYILFNLPVLKEFKNIIVATNYKNYPEFVEENTQVWKKYFSNCVIINLKINRGHNFGTADLDNAIIDYCKDNNIEWICKSANDIIIQELSLKQNISEADFYYLNGIGYRGIEQFNFDFKKIINKTFYPQTNFYIINVSKIDYLNDKQYLDYTYEITRFPEFNGRIWEYIDGWSCETFLRQCIERNNLSKKHLVSDRSYHTLLEIIKRFNIHDSSHKNIMLDGICHLHFPEKETIIINNI